MVLWLSAEEQNAVLDVIGRYRCLLLPWHVEDPCFAHLDAFRYACANGTNWEMAIGWHLFRQHYVRCGSCWNNVLATSRRAKNPFKQRVYASLCIASLGAYMERSGHECSQQPVDGGNIFRISSPPGMEDLVSRLEVFTADRPDGGSWAIIDVTSAELFTDPQPIFDRLDETAAYDVKRAGQRTEWQPIQWLEVALQWPVEAKVRWNGRIKTATKDWSFHGRYKRLLQKHSGTDVRVEANNTPHGMDQSAKAETVLKLRDLALKYDGRTPFHSFAKTVLGFREKDERCHARVDALPHAKELLEDGSTEHHGKEPGLLDKRATAETDARQSEAFSLLDLRCRLEKLRPLLTEREQRIVGLLRSEELTDRELAERLGVRRETVTRDRGKIAEKARSFFHRD